MSAEKLAVLIGVYSITCTINGKKYIGSSQDIKRRWCEHRSLLRRGLHHSRYLQNSWDKYGKDRFVFEIIEETKSADALLSEQEYLDKLKTYEPTNGFNVGRHAIAPMAGRTHTEEIKARLRDASTGENHWAWGKRQSESHNRKTSFKNKKYSDEEEKNIYEMFQSGMNYKQIKNFIGEKHTETIRRVIKRYERFREFYE